MNSIKDNVVIIEDTVNIPNLLELSVPSPTTVSVTVVSSDDDVISTTPLEEILVQLHDQNKQISEIESKQSMPPIKLQRTSDNKSKSNLDSLSKMPLPDATSYISTGHSVPTFGKAKRKLSEAEQNALVIFIYLYSIIFLSQLCFKCLYIFLSCLISLQTNFFFAN